jgi:hypothetical protein
MASPPRLPHPGRHRAAGLRARAGPGRGARGHADPVRRALFPEPTCAMRTMISTPRSAVCVSLERAVPPTTAAWSGTSHNKELPFCDNRRKADTRGHLACASCLHTGGLPGKMIMANPSMSSKPLTVRLHGIGVASCAFSISRTERDRLTTCKPIRSSVRLLNVRC